MDAEGDYEAKLLRAVMMRRLVMGVGALTFAVCSVAFACFTAYAMYDGAFRGARLPLRMIVIGLVLGLLFGLAGVVTLRRGEIDLDSGTVHGGEPVPVKLVAGATALVTLVVALLAAWPLGVYGWIGGRFSKCRELVTMEELSALAGQPLEAGELSEADADVEVCTLRIMAPGDESPVAAISVHEDHFRGGYDFKRARLSEETPVPDLGTEALRGRGGGYHHVGFLVAPSGAWVQLSEEAFDDADVEAVIERLRERASMIEPYDG